MQLFYLDPETHMQRPIRPNGQFLVYLQSVAGGPDVVLSGEELTRLVATHCATAHLLVQTATQLARTLPPARRLLNQHKSLKHGPPHNRAR